MGRFFGSGLPEGCQRLGEFTFRHRGLVDFQVRPYGHQWGCDGFFPLATLEDRKSDRMLADLFGDDSVAVGNFISIQAATGWLHYRKTATIWAVCRSIDRHIKERDAKDRAYLEAKGTRAKL